MFNHIKIFTLFKLLNLAVLLSATSVMAEQAALSNAAMPKRIQAVYEVTKNGQPFAKVHEQFIVSGTGYKVESVTKGIGVYALFGERVLTSSGEMTAQGLKPVHFELRQGDNPKKAVLADFDWTKQNLRLTVKGKLKEAPLTAGTQDLASFAYQFMFLAKPLKGDITVTLTTGKKLNQYQYHINPETEVITSAGVQYKTQHLAPPVQDTQETKELWLAADYHYVPVKILMVDDNGQKLEQTLTELRME
ncbi:DUF3108 domain-containing protein [Methylotenera sp. G11]|uniref:DUF3108 domain-containing protein n=1 Tax=Methylotenera sp. G11 TaxID=1506585 RepID=UPI00068C837F|nr:DUF3108 domain-containing protein [Methylotenera sp. G11]